MTIARTFLFAAVLGLSACGGGTSGADDAVQAATIAKEIKADPTNAASVLEKHGLTEAGFEAQLYEIAADPDASKKYNEAMGN